MGHEKATQTGPTAVHAPYDANEADDAEESTDSNDSKTGFGDVASSDVEDGGHVLRKRVQLRGYSHRFGTRSCVSCRNAMWRVKQRPLYFARLTAELCVCFGVLALLTWHWYGSNPGSAVHKSVEAMSRAWRRWTTSAPPFVRNHATSLSREPHEGVRGSELPGSQGVGR